MAKELDPKYFASESIKHFFDSSENASQLASSVIDAHIAAELFIKNDLKNISPVLLIENLSANASEVAELLQIKHLKECGDIKILRTVKFQNLLERAELYLGIKTSYLGKLNRIRNSIVHSGNLIEDEFEINLLLSKYIFPFLKDKIGDDPVFSSDWERIEKIAKHIFESFIININKKILRHKKQVEGFTQEKINALFEGFYLVGEEWVRCPSCLNNSLGIFQDCDVDYDEDGLASGYVSHWLRCKVCELDLTADEALYIKNHSEDYFENKEYIKQWNFIIHWYLEGGWIEDACL